MRWGTTTGDDATGGWRTTVRTHLPSILLRAAQGGGQLLSYTLKIRIPGLLQKIVYIAMETEI